MRIHKLHIRTQLDSHAKIYMYDVMTSMLLLTHIVKGNNKQQRLLYFPLFYLLLFFKGEKGK